MEIPVPLGTFMTKTILKQQCLTHKETISDLDKNGGRYRGTAHRKPAR